MSSQSLVAVEQRLKTIDVTKLVEYTLKIRDIGGLNNMMAPTYLRDFILGYDVANSMLATAVRCEIEVKTALDRARAIAYLDRAQDYCKEHGIKISNGVREQYVELDDDVAAAKSLYAKATAMTTFLKNKLQEFRMAHDDVKKMVYSDSYQTPNEGF
jgi:hypothetical protein